MNKTFVGGISVAHPPQVMRNNSNRIVNTETKCQIGGCGTTLSPLQEEKAAFQKQPARHVPYA